MYDTSLTLGCSVATNLQCLSAGSWNGDGKAEYVNIELLENGYVFLLALPLVPCCSPSDDISLSYLYSLEPNPIDQEYQENYRFHENGVGRQAQG
jgi:hypothetical protein